MTISSLLYRVTSPIVKSKILLVIGAVKAISLFNDAKYLSDREIVIEIDASKPLQDRISNRIFNLNSSNSHQLDLRKTIEAIKIAENDPKVTKLVAKVEDPGYYANVEELREAISSFRKSGKQTVCYASNLSKGGYYLSSSFENVYLSDVGDVPLQGSGSIGLFFKGLVERLKLDFTISRNNKLKSFPDVLLETQYTPEFKKSHLNFLDGIEDVVFRDLAQSRNLTQETIRNLSAIGPFSPQIAIQNGLADGIFLPKITEKRKKLDRYYELMKRKEKFADRIQQWTGTPQPDRIAVIYANGSISAEKDSSLNPEAMETAFYKAIRDKRVKAIVLRVNSPGGGVEPSERIGYIVGSAKRAGKPVVASYGNISASGGYWISAHADHIVANPTSIVGSIGVFGVVPHLGRFLEEYGITNDEIATQKNATYLSPLRKTIEGEILTDKFIEFISKRFEQLVSEGRNMPIENARNLATGEVWTGSQALKLGLVDSLGGLDDAIQEAMKRGNVVGRPEIVEYPRINFGSKLLHLE